jgi:hypothetical protein
VDGSGVHSKPQILASAARIPPFHIRGERLDTRFSQTRDDDSARARPALIQAFLGQARFCIRPEALVMPSDQHEGAPGALPAPAL